MGKVLESLSKQEEAFISKQKVFFVATAPNSTDHRINLSPKSPGGPSVVVLDPHTVAYLDLTGSGSETAAHILQEENGGRMTLLFCNLEVGPPKLLRLHGTAELLVKEDVPNDLLQKFPPYLTGNPGFRGVFVLSINRISSSCGFTMPVMTFQKYRRTLDEHMERMSAEEQQQYALKKNAFSIDGLESISLKRFPEKNLAPYVEAGYIFGKEGNTEDNTKSAMELAKSNRIERAKYQVKQDRYEIGFNIPTVSVFVCGLLIGGAVSGHFQANISAARNLIAEL